VIADLHLDALLDVLERRELGDDDAFAQRHLPMLEAAGVRAQVLPAFVDDRHLPESALRVTIQQLDAARREADRSDGRLRIVERAMELREAIADGAVAGILSLEGVEALGRDPGMIRTLHRLGVRMAGLTWNRANAFADGLAEQTGAGITGLGFALLDEMGQLGMALDLSHLSPRGCELALERYGGPVLASHANAAAVFANPRNLADDVLAGIGERGGVVGLCAIPAFVGPGDPAQRLAEHHAHVAAVAGADAAAFGADFCGFFGDMEPPLLPDHPTDVDTLLARQAEPARETFYAEVLSATGQPEDGPLAWGNAVRFLEGVLA
jgi:membrane dipeptidase